MKFVKTDLVLPGTSVGPLRLGMSPSEVRSILGEVEQARGYTVEVWDHPPVRIWFDDISGRVKQILVSDHFPERLPQGVGMGMTLRDVAAKLGPWRERFAQFYFASTPFTGFGFDDLEDNEDEINPGSDELEDQLVDFFVYAPRREPGGASEGKWEAWFETLPVREPYFISPGRKTRHPEVPTEHDEVKRR